MKVFYTALCGLFILAVGFVTGAVTVSNGLLRIPSGDNPAPDRVVGKWIVRSSSGAATHSLFLNEDWSFTRYIPAAAEGGFYISGHFYVKQKQVILKPEMFSDSPEKMGGRKRLTLQLSDENKLVTRGIGVLEKLQEENNYDPVPGLSSG